jgi:hypothetical protein
MIFLFPYLPPENLKNMRSSIEFDDYGDEDVARAMATHLQN